MGMLKTVEEVLFSEGAGKASLPRRCQWGYSEGTYAES